MNRKISLADVPITALWPSDNNFGIPLLDINTQATAVEPPVTLWGSTSHRAAHTGTIAFYVDDYRFERLWRDPSPIPNTGCRAVVEPNFTTTKDMPFVVAAYKIYQKRWLARWWQSVGIRVFVDLNVNPAFYDLNLLGVPQGWRAWATHGSDSHLDWLDNEYAMAAKHAGTNSILFLVYGGGEAVRAHCLHNADKGYVWLSERATAQRSQGGAG